MDTQPRSRKFRGTAAFGSLFVLSVLGAPSAWANVTAVTLAPSVKVYHGDCPAKIIFTGKVTVDAPGTVTYVFTRSDNATDTVTKTLSFASAGSKTISTSWTLGGSTLPHFKGWQAAKILTPNAVESAHAGFEVFCDPQQDSATAAHGNTDWHIDTANEFLFGKDMANNNTAANFAPSGWTKKHIHTGLTSTKHFYDDASQATPGDDADKTNGIDKPMLFFYAGHGAPTVWNTLGNNATQGDLLLGNIDGGGQLRYFWQCTCETFAHGPLVCDAGGSNCDYSEPENFNGSADSSNIRNAFERWGPALGNDLRMACGVSTLAYCHEGNVNAIWDNFNNKGMPVAEAFIDGLGSDTVRPLCITRGGPNIASTPLYDETFTNNRNTSGKGYLHMLYSGGAQRDPPGIKWRPDLIPRLIPKWRLIPPGDPPPFERGLVRVGDSEQFREAQIAGGLARVRRNAESGAVHLRALNKTQAATEASSQGKSDPRKAREAALAFARRIGWLGDDVGVVRVKPLLTASMPEHGKAADIRRGEKGVQVTIGRRLRAGQQDIDVLGQGGRIDVMLDREGKVLAASRIWRQAQAAGEVAIKPFEQARMEAMRHVQKPEGYELADWRFGYREDAANVKQDELAAVYEFDFVPRDRKQLLEFPPQRVEIRAEADAKRP